MSEEFKKAYRVGESWDWLSWCGQPMLYDGGLCVNRTIEERTYSQKHYKAELLCV